MRKQETYDGRPVRNSTFHRRVIRRSQQDLPLSPSLVRRLPQRPLRRCGTLKGPCRVNSVSRLVYAGKREQGVPSKGGYSGWWKLYHITVTKTSEQGRKGTSHKLRLIHSLNERECSAVKKVRYSVRTLVCVRTVRWWRKLAREDASGSGTTGKCRSASGKAGTASVVSDKGRCMHLRGRRESSCLRSAKVRPGDPASPVGKAPDVDFWSRLFYILGAVRYVILWRGTARGPTP